MKLAELIRSYRQENNVSMDELAKASGLSKPYISMLEKDRNSRGGKPIVPSIRTYKGLASGMGLTLDSLLKLLDGEERVSLRPLTSKPFVRIPVLGYVRAGIPIEEITDIIDWEDLPAEMVKSDETYFGLKIKGDSMEPTLYEGDVVIVEQQPEVENGEIAIVQVNDNEATVKEVKKGSDGLTLIGHNIASYSPHFYTREEVERLPITILGRVVELRRKL